jgi:hypothetical protein
MNARIWNRRGEPIVDRERPLPLSKFQDNDGHWLDADRWPSIGAILVCTNDQCSFAGQEIPAQLGENVDGRYISRCGVCGCETSRYHLLMGDDAVMA